MAKVLGVGGIFFKSKNHESLAKWYQEHLGIDIDTSYNGTMFFPANMPEKSGTVWSVFSADTEYLKPSDQTFMFNFVVDDIHEALAQVVAGGGTQVDEVTVESYGAFGWFLDPEGHKVELWQPDLVSAPEDAPTE
ncbi:MAG: VOC family protein [Pseudomonadota bacterium]